MTTTESLAYFGFVVQVAANVSVASYVFPMWRRHRLSFFAILGFSGLLGVFVPVAERVLSNQAPTAQEYLWIWFGLQILSSVDLILYAVGISLMVRHFRSSLSAPASNSDDSEQT